MTLLKWLAAVELLIHFCSFVFILTHLHSLSFIFVHVRLFMWTFITFSFILTTTCVAHSGVFKRHPVLLSILRDIKQIGSSADGVTACETRLYLQVHPYQAQQADLGTPVFHQRIRRWTAEDGVHFTASTPSLSIRICTIC